MIQKRVEWHLNIPYDLHALAQKPKDCLNQEKKLSVLLRCSFQKGSQCHLHPDCNLSKLARERNSQKATGMQGAVVIGGPVPYCGKYLTSLKCSAEGWTPAKSFITMN